MANQPPSAPVPPQGFFPFPGTEDQEHPQQQQQQQQQHQQQLQQEQLPAPPQFQQQSGQQIPQQQLQLRQQPGNPRVPPPMPGQPPMAMVPRQPMSAMAGHFCPMCNLYTAPGTYSQCGCNSFMLVQQPPYMAAHGPSPYPPMLEQNPWVMPGLPPPMHHGHMPYPPPMMMRGPPALYPPPGFMAFPPLPLPPPPHHYPRSQPHHGFMYPPHYQPAPPPTHHFGFDHHNVMFMQHPPMMVPMQPGFMPHQPMAPRPMPPPPHQMPRAPRPPAQRAQPPVPQGLQGMSIEARQGLIQVPASEVDSDSETCTSRPPNPDHVRLPTMMEYLGIAPRSGRTVQSVLDSELAKEQERASRRPPRSGAEGDAASSTHEDGKPEAMSDSDSDDGIRVIFPACGRPMDDDEVCLFEGGLPPTRNRRDYDVDHLRVAERNFNLFSRRRQHRRHREQ